MKLNYKKYNMAGPAVICCLSAMVAPAMFTGNDKNEKPDLTAIYVSGDAESITPAAPEAVPANTPVVEAAKKIKVTTFQYHSSQREGIIGNYAGKRIDNPADNIFTIILDREFSKKDKVWLVYELEGAEDFTCVPYSINDRLAKGGYLVKLSDKRSLQRERINPLWLCKGTNRITFTLPEEAGFGYRIKNLFIEVEKNTVTAPQLVVNTSQKLYGDKVYLRGFVQGAKGKTTVYLADKEIQLRDGEFETILHAPAAKTTVSATLGNGNSLSKDLVYAGDVAPDTVFALNHEVEQTEQIFLKGIPGKMGLGAAELKIDSAGLLAASKNIMITTLRAIDLPALDMGMTNVTAENGGYRFLPHGEHFADGATVSIRYDRTKIPDGYTEDDIKTFYFDLTSRHWVALERDSIDKTNRLVVSRTTHFTDMINGVIQTPESPETNGFVPTMMKDIRAADPTAKVQVIDAPSANYKGSAGLNYIFEMPPARNGMQPSLGVQYNSDGGSGLLGEGWDLNLQSIKVDTRWGVPRYSNASETETYLINGSMLIMMDAKGESDVAHRGDKTGRIADRQFYMRQAGGFARIIRKGNNPGSYTWEVTDKAGTKYIYGNAGRLAGSVKTLDGQTKEVISEWYLTRMEELHGDWIDYVYETAAEPVRGNLMAKAVYLTEIHAGNRGDDPHTVVSLVYRGSPKSKQTNSARYGFLASNNRLLDKVEIRFENELLRSYSFDYRQGAFHADILTGIRHLDQKGDLFAKYTMDYYDDVKSGSGYQPFWSEPEIWTLHVDGLDAGFVNPVSGMGIEGFSDEATALGGSVTTATSGSFYAGVGPNNADFTSKSMTVGGSVGYSGSTTKGLSTLLDINGDGLPDKVFVRGGSVYYRPNISQSDVTILIYRDAIKVEGITEISETKSSSTSGGIKTHPGYLGLTAVAGTDKSTSKSKTSVYFSDVNNDGLIDLVANGKVLFNYIENDAHGNLVPVFTSSSGDTPSPVMGGGVIDSSDTEVDPEEQAELIRNSPLLDAVRVWELHSTD